MIEPHAVNGRAVDVARLAAERDAAFGEVDGLIEENQEQDRKIKALQKQLRDLGARPSVSESVQSVRCPGVQWVEFPLDVLPPSAKGYVIAHAAAKNLDPTFIALPVLGALATAVGNSYSLEVKKSWREISALWICVISESAGGKTPGLMAGVAPIYAREKALSEEHQARMNAFAEEMEQYKNAPKSSKPDRPSRPIRSRARLGDTTIESLVLVHASNPRGLALVRDELAGWIASFDQYKSGAGSDTQSWIELYNGHALTIDRKSSEQQTLYLDSPNVTVIGGIQPGVLSTTLKNGHFDSGLVQRIIFAKPPNRRRKWSKADVDIETSTRYANLIDRLYARQAPDDGPELLHLSGEAEGLFAGFYNEQAALIDALPDGAFRSAIAKLDMLAARVALVLHVAHNDDTYKTSNPGDISYTSMYRAIELVRWVRHETARVYQSMGFEERSLTKEQQLLRSLPDPFGWQELAEVKGGIQKSGAYKIIRELESRGLIKQSSENCYSKAGKDALPIDWSLFTEDTWTPDTLDTLEDLPEQLDSYQPNDLSAPF